MIAILSDIHGNLEALEGVLRDMEAFPVESVICLGDIIGYGPEPIACLEHAMSWKVVLRGYFEGAALTGGDLEGWTAAEARRSMLDFRQQLAGYRRAGAIHEFLSSLPTRHDLNGAVCVHGSPRNPLEYIFPEDVSNGRKMDRIDASFESLCFCGHTHIPGVIERRVEKWVHQTPAECGPEYVPGRKVICNVGSVGRPHDGDPRASYVLFREGTILFRRVAPR